MDDRIKMSAAVEQLERLGYTYNNTAQDVIDLCDQWYTGRESSFHKRKNLNGVEIVVESLNFAKRGCADDANLCEILEINAGKNAEKFNGVRRILDENRFSPMYRRQLEQLSAHGTVGAYIRLEGADLMEDGAVRGGRIMINYVAAPGIAPLTVINDDVVECAFMGPNMIDGKLQQTLVIFKRDDSLRYSAVTYQFNAQGAMIGEPQEIQLGDVKPFAIMRTAVVNNLDDMEGYGYPKLYGAIPVLKVLDLCWNILQGDLSKGDKLLLVNELLAEVKRDADGKPQMTPQQKELFILLGEKLPDQKSLVQEYNPEIRVQPIKDTFELCLSLFSMMFGFGTKKYTFEQGQIKTATEYIGERQDAMQELNRQRYESTQYIRDIIRAVIWYSNTFSGTHWQPDEEICIEYDDSYVTDRQTQLEALRMDALSFPDVPEFTIQYVMMRLNCEREEALAYISGQDPDAGDETED